MRALCGCVLERLSWCSCFLANLLPLKLLKSTLVVFEETVGVVLTGGACAWALLVSLGSLAELVALINSGSHFPSPLDLAYLLGFDLL